MTVQADLWSFHCKFKHRWWWHRTSYLGLCRCSRKYLGLL